MHILEEIREVAVSKNVNFLIGSGCSVGAIDRMSKYWEDAWRERNINEDKKEKSPTCCKDKEYCDECKQRGNDLLIEDVKRVSKMILEKDENTEEANLKKIQDVSKAYIYFVQEAISLMNRMNSRQTPRNINIFTTNYDLFIENALDEVSKAETFVINDGARGYFRRVLDSSNFNRTVSYRGPSNNYVDEIPSISLIKPHGSVNWEKVGNHNIEIKAEVVDTPVIVKPDGHESRSVFEENYFNEALRIFESELGKTQSILFVIGFSFQDRHIVQMMRRALKNRELNVYVFSYSNEGMVGILNNLDYERPLGNLKFVCPVDISNNKKNRKVNNITLNIVLQILKGEL